jgi:AcrR family transcriptional regulator
VTTTPAPQTRKRPARQRAVASADRLFYERGVHAVGVDQITEDAGISKASLYTHFRTKDDLVVNYLVGRSEAWQEHVEAELPKRAEAPGDRAVAVFDLLGEWFDEPGYRGCPFINVEAEFGHDHPSHDVTLAHRTCASSSRHFSVRPASTNQNSSHSSCACCTTERWPVRKPIPAAPGHRPLAEQLDASLLSREHRPADSRRHGQSAARSRSH